MPVVPDASFTSLPSWQPNTFCCSSWDTLTPDQQAYATMISAWVMWALTGRRYGLESRTVRPCFAPGLPPVYQVYPVYLLNPWGSDDASTWSPAYIQDGVWHNKGCCGNGCCGAACEVVLEGPVSSVTNVTIDGVTVDPTTYRVDDKRLLVRQKDPTTGVNPCWPACQDFNKITGEQNTWSVTYLWGLDIPPALLAAQGVLACEIANACSGKPCRLPQRMQSLTRAGVTAQFVQPSAYIDRGLTNLPDVDAAIAQANPNRLTTPPLVLSPDVARNRQTTWSSP